MLEVKNDVNFYFVLFINKDNLDKTNNEITLEKW